MSVMKSSPKKSGHAIHKVRRHEWHQILKTLVTRKETKLPSTVKHDHSPRLRHG